METMEKGLAEAFLPHPHGLEESDVEFLSAELAGAFERGRCKWPRFRVDATKFARHLGGLWAGKGRALDWVAQREFEELYFALACLERDPVALQELEPMVTAAVPKQLARLRLSEADQDDIRQDLLLRLLEHASDEPHCLTGYDGTGKLKGYLQTIAYRSAVDVQRKRGKETSVELAPVVRDDDLERKHMRALYGVPVTDSLFAAAGELTPKERRMVWLYFFKGRSIDQLAKVLQKHRATAHRRLVRIVKTILARSKQRLHDSLGVNEKEAQSLMALVRSDLEISLTKFIQKKD
jgi:RNA polymerase sigma-70 factor, ECF subfamily